MSMCGSFSAAVKEATVSEQEILDLVKSEIEEKLSIKGAEIKALTFTTQVVAGVNYMMKISVKSGESISYAHCKIGKPLPHTNKPPFLMEIAHTDIDESSSLVPI